MSVSDYGLEKAAKAIGDPGGYGKSLAQSVEHHGQQVNMGMGLIANALNNLALAIKAEKELPPHCPNCGQSL
jgi:hypothetical protein